MILAARTRSELEETAQQLATLGASPCIIPTDVSDQDQVEQMVRQALAWCPTIDILVNNAAIVGPIAPLWETDVSSWMQTIQVNLIGTYLCCRALLPVMLQQNRGKIINVTSGLRARGATFRKRRHMAAYVSSKAAVTQFTELFSYQLVGKNIQVNVMSPAGNTKMLEELRDRTKQIGETELYEDTQQVIAADPIERSAALAVFLASDASGNLSGRGIAYRDDLPTLASHIQGIMASEDAYTLRQVEWE